MAKQRGCAFAIMPHMKRRSARSARYLDLELAHVDLVRGGRRVLRDLHWRIRPGERWVLQGANGAGKTQLLKLIAGDIWPQPRADTRRYYRWRGELRTEPYGIKEEIAYLGAERQDRYQHYEWNHRVETVVGTGIQRTDTPLAPLTAAERARVGRLLRRLRIAELAKRRFLTLSQGERRLVLLARALASRPALLLLDEPLNGLDAANRERILSALRTFARARLPWVYASHRPEEVPHGATHLATLRRGRLRTASRLRPIPPAPRRTAAARTSRSKRASELPILIRLRRASVWREGRLALRNLSLEIRRGECWLVHGANGSGKSTLLGTLYGDHGVASKGTLWRDQPTLGGTLGDVRTRIGYLSPELQAALPRAQSVRDCVIAAMRGAYLLDGVASAIERRRAGTALERVRAQHLARRSFGELSYGQARRVLFARALALQPDIVLLDEPYTGLDAATRRRLRSLVEERIRAGVTVVIASHHKDDSPRGATHELELRAGAARYCGPLPGHASVRKGLPS